jgi:hypothetical protein
MKKWVTLWPSFAGGLMKRIIGMLLLSLGATAMEPTGLWGASTGTTIPDQQTISTNIYKIEPDKVLIIRGVETNSGFSFDINNAEVYTADERFIEQRLQPRENQRGIEINYCKTTYGRSYREGDQVVVHLRTFEREVLLDCPFRKAVRHRGGQGLPVSQTIFRFVADEAGGVSLSRTRIERGENQDQTPERFLPLVRLD